MIYKWHSIFKQTREPIKDDPRPGRIIEATMSNIAENIEKNTYEGIPDTAILRALHNYLRLKKSVQDGYREYSRPPQNHK